MMKKAFAKIVDVQPIRKSKLPVSLRMPKDEHRYHKAKKQGAARKSLLDEPRLREWEHWALIENAFPYSSAFSTHHMLVPKRVVSRKDLSKQEQAELHIVLEELEPVYDCYLVNFPSKQSIVHHYHIHMLVYKTERRQLRI
jgi:hypothetical protein